MHTLPQRLLRQGDEPLGVGRPVLHQDSRAARTCGSGHQRGAQGQRQGQLSHQARAGGHLQQGGEGQRQPRQHRVGGLGHQGGEGAEHHHRAADHQHGLGGLGHCLAEG